ncbi:GNAT family N-acetyltransferase [Celerinatantimonas yamalensis]|uniref:GNAT family N-acetyltransferase n=1 Tax=Celerinatantimonas yamalensis TaxID=559956 RepID=A0ABW9GBZ8_9GAMM
MKPQRYQLKEITAPSEVEVLYPLVTQLRPNLQTVDEFIQCWQRQRQQGYCIIALYDKQVAVAMAGYRVEENLAHGRFLYVDDLVTDQHVRSQGYGEQLLVFLRDQAIILGCKKIVLDTPLSNALGHRFYFRCNLLATSLRFAQTI